ncbi:DUF7948 domain-containing protein [Rufibacter roseus]|uniref:Gliding motility-associated C-terminal domain-containing protein n=1 Tax=Rufibacter roseus TaxID=1567108 RepID=A0ABW2DKT9_9BACT|nr:gliding motility-associated C-terminal domain-containing protein [Rufibacter roseus]
MPAPVSVHDDRSLEFVENKGQWPAQVKFSAEIPSGRMFLEPTGFLYVLQDPAAKAKAHNHDSGTTQPTAKSADTGKAKAHAYSVSFEGANVHSLTQGQEITPGVRNYYLGKDPKKWGSGAKGYRQVQYKSLYQGVDMALYEQNGNLKYDLHVAPGTSPAQIKLKYKGATRLSLKEGNLLIETSVGTVTEQRPVAFQVVNGQRQIVPCQYVLKGETLSFAFPEGYSTELPLVIDPVIVFSTFSGSFADNWGFTATHDSEGNMYSGGIVDNVGFPVSLGAFMMTHNGAWDISIIKYNTQVSGTASRLYATYLGGSQTDTPHSLVVNQDDELLILGTTGSNDYPTSANAFSRSFKGGTPITPLGGSGNPSYNGGSDLIVTRLSKNGEQMIASTFLGGTENDGIMAFPSGIGLSLVKNYGDQYRGDIVTDPAGNVYIASNTMSTDFPAKNGFRSQSNGGPYDAIITKLSPDLSNIVWSNYFGGSGLDAAYSIQVDKDYNVFVAGGTTSATLPGSNLGYQKSLSGNVDGFVAKINSAGNGVLATSYLGTTNYDQVYFLQLDAIGDVYLFGQTLGNYPVTNGTYRNANGRQFIHKLSANLATSVFSTVFGAGRNTVDISPSAFLVDDCQRIYVSGWGGGSNATSYNNGNTFGLPATSNALQTTTDGGDFYLMQLGTNASELLYATFYGGDQGVTGGSTEHVDGGTSRFDKRGFVYQAVCGGCQRKSNFPMPPGANYFSKTNPSPNCNNAAFKFDFVEELSADAGEDKKVCFNGDPLRLEGFPAGGVWSGTGVSVSNGVYWFNTMPELVGNHVLTYTVTGTGACSRNSTMVLTVEPPTEHTITMAANEFCSNSSEPVLMEAQPAGGTFSGKGVVGNTFIPSVAGIGKHTIIYKNTGQNGICGEITKEVTVYIPLLNLGPDTVLCPGSTTPFQLKANFTGGTWSGQHVTADGTFTPPANFTGSVELTYSIATPCIATATRRVQVAPVPIIQAALANPCPNISTISGFAPFNASFTNTTTNATGYVWDFGDGETSEEQTPRHLYTKPGTYKVLLTAMYGNGCEIQQEVAQVVVTESFVPNIITPNGDGKNDTFVQNFSCLPTELVVYNRWGKELYREKEYNQNWDGGVLSEGTYFYILTDTEGKTAKGWVEIVR